MKYNSGYFQFRDYQVETMGKIIEKNLRANKGGLVFYGDSITENYNIEKYFPEIETKYNSGISGFTSESLLWFCDEAVIKYQPDLVILMIGINDSGETCMLSPKQTACNIKNPLSEVNVAKAIKKATAYGFDVKIFIKAIETLQDRLLDEK